MDHFQQRQQRIRDIQKIFVDFGFGDDELLDDWDGIELEDLSRWLTEDEYELLLDQLEYEDDV